MSDGHIGDLLEAIPRAEKHHSDENLQKILTNKKLPGDLLSVRNSIKSLIKKTVDDPLEAFRNKGMEWRFSGYGTQTMSRIGFPAFFYEFPESLLDPVSYFMRESKTLIMSCLFQSSVTELLALVAFNIKHLDQKRRTVELMFFDQKGQSCRVTQHLKLSYVTTVRLQQFPLNKGNLENVLKLVLATDLSSSIAYTALGKCSELALQTERQAVWNFRQNKLVFTRLKQDIKRIIDRGDSPEKRTLNNLEMVQNNMRTLHESILKFHLRLAQIHRKNTILLHEFHKEIRKIYGVQAEMYKLQSKISESYNELVECTERRRQSSLELELLMLKTKESEELFRLTCERLANATLREVRMARPRKSRRKQTLI